MPTLPSPSPKFRMAGFPQYGFKAGMSDRAFPFGACPSRRSVGLRPSCSPLAASESPYCAGGRRALEYLRGERPRPLYPRGPRSSLIRPHPPHSQAHLDFTAGRLIRDAFAVRHRLGDPRVVPCFRCAFLLGMPSSVTAGVHRLLLLSSFADDAGLRRESTGSALPSLPSSASDGRVNFAASPVRCCYGLSSCLPPGGSDRAPPSGTFTRWNTS